VGRWWRKAFYKPPFLTVTPYGGRIAILEISNSGGKAALTVWGRIVDGGGWTSKHRGLYPMLWRPHFEEALLAAPKGAVLRAGSPPLALWVAGHEILNVAGMLPQTILAIFGGPGKVDAIHVDPKHGSPRLTIEVTIFCDPPTIDPWTRRYSVQIEKNYQSVVELGEITQ
jgi:hypothetical protein